MGTEFDRRLPVYEKLRDEVDSALAEAVDTQNLKIHHYSSRLKDKQSFLEKISRKDYHHPFRDMRDLVGARVVCYSLRIWLPLMQSFEGPSTS